jgi:hypothetical protein
MTFTGAIFGTIVNILLPTLFYNRAYTNTSKNRALNRPSKDDDEKEELISKKSKKSKKKEKDDDSDPRLLVKICSYIVLVVGIIIAIIGFAYVCYKLSTGAESDHA